MIFRFFIIVFAIIFFPARSGISEEIYALEKTDEEHVQSMFQFLQKTIFNSGISVREIDIVRSLKLSKSEIETILNKLNNDGLILLNDSGYVTTAYPFTSNHTEQRIKNNSSKRRYIT